MSNKDYSEIILSWKINDLISVPSQDFISYIWYDKNGEFTDDPKKLFRKEEFITPQTRYAETPDDYEFILKREAEKRNVDTDDYVEIFLEDFKPLFDQHINEYKRLGVELVDRRIVFKKFVKYLEGRKTHMTLKRTCSLEDIQFIETILPKINEHITKGSTIEDWVNLFECKEPNKVMINFCTNKLLAMFIVELRNKRQFSIANTDVAKYFGLSDRFIETALRSRTTKEDKGILQEIFTTVQK